MLEPIFDAGSGRDAIGIGQAAGKGLNTRHGTILTCLLYTSPSPRD